MFKNRADAGKQLANKLKSYKDKPNTIVLGIPRGGVEPAYHVAKALNLALSMLIVRKLPLPYNPEAGFGAIAEDGTTYLHPKATEWVSNNEIKRVKAEQRLELKRRIKALRGGRDLPDIKDKTIILVDDGIAMGSTIIAGIKACKRLGAEQVIVAVPVSSREVGLKIGEIVDVLIVLETPDEFSCVAQVYKEWHDATDQEVRELMKNFKKNR